MPHGSRHRSTSGVNGTTLATSDPAKNLTPPAYATEQARTFVGAKTVTTRRRERGKWVTSTKSVGGTGIYHKTVVNPSPNGSCLLYTSPSPRDKRQSRMPSSA